MCTRGEGRSRCVDSVAAVVHCVAVCVCSKEIIGLLSVQV